MDLRCRLELSGVGLMAILDPEHEHLPTDGYECAHDLGRYRFAWVGDEIVGVDPQDAPEPFYPAR